MKKKNTSKPQKVIIRADRAGIFAGFIKRRKGGEVTLAKARRLWRWAGAATLSQLASEGVKTPEECMFTIELDEITILGVIEIIPMTQEAVESINQVPVWKR